MRWSCLPIVARSCPNSADPRKHRVEIVADVRFAAGVAILSTAVRPLTGFSRSLDLYIPYSSKQRAEAEQGRIHDTTCSYT